MQTLARLVDPHIVLPLRTRYRQEMNCQIVKDSIHTRPGWSLTFALSLAGAVVVFVKADQAARRCQAQETQQQAPVPFIA